MKHFNHRLCTWLAFALVICIILCTFSGCGRSKWVGVYGGTSTSGKKVEITVLKDHTVTYTRNGREIKGTWTERDNSILLDFGGKVSDKHEPLIVTMSSDGNEITVESNSSGWNVDHYTRR